jgi:hypothetical protein
MQRWFHPLGAARAEAPFNLEDCTAPIKIAALIQERKIIDATDAYR